MASVLSKTLCFSSAALDATSFLVFSFVLSHLATARRTACSISLAGNLGAGAS